MLVASDTIAACRITQKLRPDPNSSCRHRRVNAKAIRPAAASAGLRLEKSRRRSVPADHWLGETFLTYPGTDCDIGESQKDIESE